MTSTVTLTLRAPVERTLEIDGLSADRLATLSEREIAMLPLWDGRDQLRLGDLFDVRGARGATVHVVGDLSYLDGLGAGMAGGELVVAGNVGRRVGHRMTGGVIRVLGDAGAAAGLEMAGGVLEITGNAGDHVGGAEAGSSKGMRGGELIVHGTAGAGVGARMRRGTIVCARAGPQTGEGMIAGNVLVLGPVHDNVGRYNKRGSIAVLGSISVPAVYRYACTYHPPHLALMLRHLRARFHLPITDRHIAGAYRRWSGDMSELGRGEILQWVGEEHSA